MLSGITGFPCTAHRAAFAASRCERHRQSIAPRVVRQGTQALIVCIKMVGLVHNVLHKPPRGSAKPPHRETMTIGRICERWKPIGTPRFKTGVMTHVVSGDSRNDFLQPGSFVSHCVNSPAAGSSDVTGALTHTPGPPWPLRFPPHGFPFNLQSSIFNPVNM